MPGGRPSSFKPEYCDQLIDFMSTDGQTYQEFAGEIGVAIQTLYTWEKNHPEFLDAKQRGLAKCLQWWMKQGRLGLWMERATKQVGGKFVTEERKLNEKIWTVCMKNIHGWVDKVEHRVEDDKPIKIAYDPAG